MWNYFKCKILSCEKNRNRDHDELNMVSKGEIITCDFFFLILCILASAIVCLVTTWTSEMFLGYIKKDFSQMTNCLEIPRKLHSKTKKKHIISANLLGQLTVVIVWIVQPSSYSYFKSFFKINSLIFLIFFWNLVNMFYNSACLRPNAWDNNFPQLFLRSSATTLFLVFLVEV